MKDAAWVINDPARLEAALALALALGPPTAILPFSHHLTHRALWLLHSRQYRQNVKIFNPSSLTPCWARLADGLPKFISLLISPSREQQGLIRRGPQLNKIPSINANLIDSDWDLIISLNFLADFMWLTSCQLDCLTSCLPPVFLSFPFLSHPVRSSLNKLMKRINFLAIILRIALIDLKMFDLTGCPQWWAK